MLVLLFLIYLWRLWACVLLCSVASTFYCLRTRHSRACVLPCCSTSSSYSMVHVPRTGRHALPSLYCTPLKWPRILLPPQPVPPRCPALLCSPMLAPLDALRGPVRWEICFNLSLLRMLSFALDLHWRRHRAQSGPGVPGGGYSAPVQEGRGPKGSEASERAAAATGAPALLSRPASLAKPAEAEPGQQQQEREQHTQRQQPKCTVSGEDQQPEQQQPKCMDTLYKPAGRRRLSPAESAARWRQATPLPSEHDYSLAMFLAYVFYLPLYLAGPITTFQDFAWQLRRPARPSRREVRARLWVAGNGAGAESAANLSVRLT